MNQTNSSWWQNSIIYQIYPRSFRDSNGDGIGDLPGIIEKLPYLHDLGIDVIWLSPIYASPNEDNGYDISDYYSIHPDYGTMEDFDHLIERAREFGIRIIMDLVINHTSTEHKWFQEGRKKDSPYHDYYIWRDQPNNWTGFFGGGCWEYDHCCHQYYLHLFAPHQADLNYHNPAVFAEVEKILRFWLEKGVAGFRCDVINILYKDSLENGKAKPILTGSEHYLTLDGTHEILRKINAILQEYNAFTVGETCFVNTKQACLLSSPERNELNMVFGFEHMEVDQYVVKWFKKNFHWKKMIATLDRWQREVPWNTIYFENHDQPRSISRFGSQRYKVQSGKLLATLLLTLRGTPFIFEGEEIGMENFDYTSMAQVHDVESIRIYALLKKLHIPPSTRWKMIQSTSRDNARTPMQWNSDVNAGFSTGIPWLEVNKNFQQINVSAQERDHRSILNYYRTLIALRKTHSDLSNGDYYLLDSRENLTAYKRGDLTIILNHSDKPSKTTLQGNLILSSYGYSRYDGTLQPWEAVILK